LNEVYSSLLQVEKLKKWKHERIEQMASDLEDDAATGSDMDRRLAELRREVRRNLEKVVAIVLLLKWWRKSKLIFLTCDSQDFM
jgi:hypothetical protein